MVKHRKLSATELAHSYDYLVEQFNQEWRLARDGVPFDYFIGGSELACAPTAFLGGLAAEWGLVDSRVTEVHFFNLGDGKHARTGEELVKSSQGSRVRMHELMVSAPKSLSLALAAADKTQHEEIIAALRESTAELVGYIESTLPLVRRRVDSEESHEQAAGLIAMSFEHLTSRQSPEGLAAGLPLAPQWHNHLQISNIALRQPDKLAADGSRYGAVDSFHLTKEQKLLDCLFQLGVKDKLEAKGYRIETTREVEARTAELTGQAPEHSKNREIFIHGITDRELLLKWSPRTKQVTDYFKGEMEKLRRQGIAADSLPSRQLAEIFQMAKITGRMTKVPPAPDQIELWQAMLAEHGIAAATLDRAKQLGPRDRRKLTKGFIVRQALARLPEVRSVITWSELRGLLGEECLSYGTSREICIELAGQVWGIEDAEESAATIGRKLKRADELRLTREQIDDLRAAQARSKAEAASLAGEFSPELVVLTDASATTQTQLETERAVVGAVGEWARAPLPAVGPTFAVNAVAVKALADHALADEVDYDPRKGLSPDQAASLKAILTKGRVTVTQGEAGTGKTFVAKAAAYAWRASRPNAQVIALAVSKARVKNFGEEIGADQAVVFEKIKELAAIDSDTLFVVDELAMVDTLRLSMLVKEVGKSRPGFIGIGDPAQLAGLGAARLWEELKEASGVKVPPITTIQRTKDPIYGEVWKQLRDPRQVREAVAWLDQQGLITVVADKETAIQVAIEQWDKSRKKAAKRHGKSSSAQARIITGLSNAEIDDISRLAQLWLLAGGELKGEPVTVEWTDPQNPTYKREFDVYSGDVVQFSKNFSVKQDGKRIDISNGDVAMIRKARPGLDGKDATLEVELIRKGGNKFVELTKPKQLGNCRLNYAGHAFKVQGSNSTCDPVYLDTPNSTLESIYMANTRGRNLARTRSVVALDELIPDLNERKAEFTAKEQEKARKELAARDTEPDTAVSDINELLLDTNPGPSTTLPEFNVHQASLEALTKRWMRTLDADVPAITLARQAGIGQANLSEPSIVLPRMQQKPEMRGLSRAA